MAEEQAHSSLDPASDSSSDPASPSSDPSTEPSTLPVPDEAVSPTETAPLAADLLPESDTSAEIPALDGEAGSPDTGSIGSQSADPDDPEGIAHSSSPEPVSAAMPAPAMAEPVGAPSTEKPAPLRSPIPIEMSDAATFDSKDAFVTVISTAKTTFQQVWAVVLQVWEAIAPILRAFAILGLRLLILIGQWGLEQLNATEAAPDAPPKRHRAVPRSTKSTPRRVVDPRTTTSNTSPRSELGAIAPGLDTPLDDLDKSSQAAFAENEIDGDKESDDLQLVGDRDDRLEDGDHEEYDDDSNDLNDLDDRDDALDDAEYDDSDDEELDDALDNAPAQTPSASDRPAADRPLLLRLSLKALRLAWMVLIRLGRLLLPKPLKEALPNPVVGGLMTAVLVAVLWISNALRPASLASEPVPSVLPSLEEPAPNAEPFLESPDATASGALNDSNEVETPDISELDAPSLDVQPDAALIRDLQDQMADLTASYGDGLLQSVQANFVRGRLIVTVSEGWNELGSDRPRLAAKLWERSQSLGFSKMEIVDVKGTILARSPVVGDQMLMFERQAAPVPQAILEDVPDPAEAIAPDESPLPNPEDPLPTIDSETVVDDPTGALPDEAAPADSSETDPNETDSSEVEAAIAPDLGGFERGDFDLDDSALVEPAVGDLAPVSADAADPERSLPNATAESVTDQAPLPPRRPSSFLLSA